MQSSLLELLRHRPFSQPCGCKGTKLSANLFHFPPPFYIYIKAKRAKMHRFRILARIGSLLGSLVACPRKNTSLCRSMSVGLSAHLRLFLLRSLYPVLNLNARDTLEVVKVLGDHHVTVVDCRRAYEHVKLLYQLAVAAQVSFRSGVCGQ